MLQESCPLADYTTLGRQVYPARYPAFQAQELATLPVDGSFHPEHNDAVGEMQSVMAWNPRTVRLVVPE